ncbi:MAG TPA: DUF3761 domain-containing protein [Pseudonocardiaceae bacterium]
MSPIGPHARSRKILASLAICSAVFVSGASVAGCQNETTAQPTGSQLSTVVGSNSAAPSANQASVPDPTPVPRPTTSATTPLIPIKSVQAAPRLAPPAPRPVPAPAIAVAPHTRSAPASSVQESSSCDGDYYRNSDGNCVHRPQQAAAPPPGATARCNDGTYSFSQHRQGTCSGHRGVAQWL